jgi:hypothetical protein
MFDLNKAIANWLRQLAAGGRMSPEVLDELESHLRDDIEQQVRCGAEPQKAFESAVRHLGPATALEKEFAKSPGARQLRRRRFVQGSCFISAVFVLLINTWTLVEFDLTAWQRVIGFSVVVLAALYLAGLPLLLSLLSRTAYAQLQAAVKMASLFTPIVPILAILTARHVIRFEFGILPTLIVWLLYAAIVMTIFACGFGRDRGWDGGSTGPISPVPRGPLPIPPGRLCPPDFSIPLPRGNQFAPVARQSLEIAREEAWRLGHDFVGTEHLLLGVLRLANGVVAGVLQHNNVDCEAVRKEIERLVVAQTPQTSAVALPLTPRAQKALKKAGNEAKTHHHPAVNVEHILLGLLLEGGGVAAQALKNLGIGIGQVRQELSRAGAGE